MQELWPTAPRDVIPDLKLEDPRRFGWRLPMRCISRAQGLEMKALLPNGVSSLGNVEKNEHLTESTAKGPALDWSKYIKV